MHTDLHRYLDGDAIRDDLPAELQRDADRFDLWARTLTPVAREGAPAWLENRIMVSLPARPDARLRTRVGAWLLEPRKVRVRPVTVGFAAAAALAFLLLAPRERLIIPGAHDGPANNAALPVASGTQVYWQFVLSAPDAHSVSVAGSFNSWAPEGIALRDLDGDGVWTGQVPLRPGLHKYMFIVDDEHWVTDPRAERYVDDGFGMRNAVITVAPPAARTL